MKIRITKLNLNNKIKSALAQIRRISIIVLLTVIISGALFNFFIKDIIWPFSSIYYLLPLRVLIILTVIYLLISIKSKIHIIISIAFLALFIYLEFFSGSGFIYNNLKPKLAVWNVGRNQTSIEDMVDFVNEKEPEIFIIIEFDRNNRKKRDLSLFEELLPEYHLKQIDGNMAVIHKRKSEFKFIKHHNDSYNYFNVAEIDGYKFALVDIGSWPLYNRKIPFDMLYTLVDEYNPDVICGDFNTLYGSIYFDRLLFDYNCGVSNAVYQRSTWPSYFPIASIDHIFIRDKFKILDYHPDFRNESEHFPLLVSFY